jgi:hypothetical protein
MKPAQKPIEVSLDEWKNSPLLSRELKSFLHSIDSRSPKYDAKVMQRLKEQANDLVKIHYQTTEGKPFEFEITEQEIFGLYQHIVRGVLYVGKYYANTKEGSTADTIKEITLSPTDDEIPSAMAELIEKNEIAGKKQMGIGIFPQLLIEYSFHDKKKQRKLLSGQGRITEASKMPGHFFNCAELAILGGGVEEAGHVQQVCKGRFVEGEFYKDTTTLADAPEQFDMQKYLADPNEVEVKELWRQAAKDLKLGSSKRDPDGAELDWKDVIQALKTSRFNQR